MLKPGHRLKALIRGGLDLPLLLIFSPLIVVNLCIHICYRIITFWQPKNKPRLLFGVTPIISIAHITRALKTQGYQSESAVVGESTIYARTTFDHVLVPTKSWPKLIKLLLSQAQAYLFFLKAIWRYDIFHYYFDGGLLRHTLCNNIELTLLRLIGKKIILLPYGSDAFVYDTIPNPVWRHALMLEYAQFGNHAAKIQQKLRTMTAKADIVVGCLVHFINLPRWDILPLTCYPVDLDQIVPLYPENTNNKPIRIAHACNHRGVKGTAFLIAAVERLQREGWSIELDIIEKVPHENALARIAQCDVYVDQLIFGYAQAALEALACGKVVITALDNHPAYDLFRHFSYLHECPMVSANYANIEQVLRKLFADRTQWYELGQRSHEFVSKRHSYPACAAMFTAIYDKIWWHSDIDLINFYHPLLEKRHEGSPSTL